MILQVQINKMRFMMALAENYDESNDFVGAGIVPFCNSTNKFLVGLRSGDVYEGGTWAGFGGKVESDETGDVREAAIRELSEECGFHGSIRLISGYVYKEPEFVYHNFIGVVEDDFDPRLNWEHDDAIWVDYAELLNLPNKHYGLSKFLNESKQIFESLIK